MTKLFAFLCFFVSVSILIGALWALADWPNLNWFIGFVIAATVSIALTVAGWEIWNDE